MKKMEFYKKIIVLVCLSIGILAGGLSVVTVQAKTEEEKICKGIYIEDIDVGGMTVAEAEAAVEEYVGKLENKKITVKVGKNKTTTTLKELGYSCEENSYIEEAANFGQSGNVIKRYKELKDIEKEPVSYHLEFQLDDEKVKEFVKEKCASFDIEPKNATLIRENGKFNITESKKGRKVVIDETIEKIKAAILEDWKEEKLVINAVVNDAEPKYSSEVLQRCSDLLGSYNTSYASSGQNRSQNLTNAARLLNGYVIYPGETFSVAEKLVPFTIENGYETAAAYSQGQVVDSIGGGVCQASTTLYNALLEAELEIVERYNHSMIVSYVKPSMDAAISEGYKDLKFKNNTEVPIYIEGYTQGRTIYFNIYGEEKRDMVNRKVEYESEVLEQIPPGADKITYDNTKPESYFAVTQSAHVGYKAQLWKVVYENGEQVSREKVNYSYYAPEPRYVVKGAKATEKPKETKEPDEKETKEPKSTKKTKATKKPSKATPKPKKTKAPEADKTSKTEDTEE